MTTQTVRARLSISTWRLKRLLNQLRFYENVYLEISDGEVVVAHPHGDIATYCTFNKYYFNLISTESEGIVQALVDVDKFYQYVRRVEGDTTVLNFLSEHEDSVATEMEIEGGLNARIHLATPEVEIRWNRVEAIADTYDIEVPDVEDPWEIAQLLYERISEDINRQYPEEVYREIIGEGTSFHPEGAQAGLTNMRNSFNSDNIFGTYEDSIHKPMPTRVEVIVDSLCDIISGYNSLGEFDLYQLIVDEKEARVRAPGLSGEPSTQLPVLSVSGPSVQNEYGKEFEWIPTLSDTVELQTAPDDAPLALVQRDKGLVIRHVIAPA